MAVKDVIEAARGSFSALRQSPARVPTWTKIPPERVDERIGDGELKPRAQYFEVRVHRIFLAQEREWFTRYTPLLLAGAEFSYDGQEMFAPTVVGPATLQRLGGAVPAEGVVARTRIAGPVPYVGDQLAVSVVLYKLEHSNVAQPFLDALESVSGVLDLAAGILPYAKIARVVLTGVGAATGGTKPVLAWADQFSPPTQGYYALVDADVPVDEHSLSVAKGELYADGKPLRSGDYVLYSVNAFDQGSVDVTRLPLYRQWQAVLGEAAKAATDEIWESAKVNFSSLVSMLYTSPDLTRDHAAALKSEWQDMLVQRRKDALEIAHLSDRTSPLDRVRSDALAVLEL
jgi:hypothetical protein